MSQYFDKDFFKFLLGFAAIILISCAVILATKVYQAQLEGKLVPITNVAKP